MRDLAEANECEVCPFGYMRKKDFSADGKWRTCEEE